MLSAVFIWFVYWQSSASSENVDPLEIKQISSKGWPVFIGGLYDAKNDKFDPTMTLWDMATLIKGTVEHPAFHSDFVSTTTDDTNSKLDFLDVSASLGLQLSGGTVGVTGSFSFLKDDRNSNNVIRVSVNQKLRTRFRQLSVDLLEKIQFPDQLDKPYATHVVTGIIYGANGIFNFDQTFEENTDKISTEGSLTAAVNMVVVKASATGKIEFSNIIENKNKTTSISFDGDYILPRNPRNITEAAAILRDMVASLGDKLQFDVPMTVFLYPLARLSNRAQKMTAEIGAALIKRVEAVIDVIKDIKRELGGLQETAVFNQFDQLIRERFIFSLKIDAFMDMFMRQLTTILPLIRGGSNGEVKLAKTLAKHAQSPFKESDMRKFVSTKTAEGKILQSWYDSMTKRGIIWGTKTGRFEYAINSIQFSSVVVLVLKIFREEGDAYFEALDYYLKNQVTVPIKPFTIGYWYTDRNTSANFTRATRLFMKYAEANKLDQSQNSSFLSKLNGKFHKEAQFVDNVTRTQQKFPTNTIRSPSKLGFAVVTEMLEITENHTELPNVEIRLYHNTVKRRDVILLPTPTHLDVKYVNKSAVEVTWNYTREALKGVRKFVVDIKAKEDPPAQWESILVKKLTSGPLAQMVTQKAYLLDLQLRRTYQICVWSTHIEDRMGFGPRSRILEFYHMQPLSQAQT